MKKLLTILLFISCNDQPLEKKTAVVDTNKINKTGFTVMAVTQPDSVRLTYLETQMIIVKQMIGLNKLDIKDSIKNLRGLYSSVDKRTRVIEDSLKKFKNIVPKYPLYYQKVDNPDIPDTLGIIK